MDTSETYVRMCKRATELQEGYVPKGGAYLCYLPTQEIHSVLFLQLKNGVQAKSPHWDKLPDGYIYLPTQDQLQAMVVVKNNDVLKDKGIFWTTHLDFTDFWLERDIGPGKFDNCTLEQLWLMFVMSKKYGKVWNGIDWVRDDGH